MGRGQVAGVCQPAQRPWPVREQVEQGNATVENANLPVMRVAPVPASGMLSIIWNMLSQYLETVTEGNTRPETTIGCRPMAGIARVDRDGHDCTPV